MLPHNLRGSMEIDNGLRKKNKNPRLFETGIIYDEVIEENG